MSTSKSLQTYHYEGVPQASAHIKFLKVGYMSLLDARDGRTPSTSVPSESDLLLCHFHDSSKVTMISHHLGSQHCMRQEQAESRFSGAKCAPANA